MAKRESAYAQVLREKQKEAEQQNSQTVKQPDSQAEEQPDNQTLKHQDVETAKQEDRKTSRQENGQMSKQQNSKTVKQQRIKATFYLEPEDVIAIDEMQTKRFRQHGKKPEKSELVSEAIQLLKQLNI